MTTRACNGRHWMLMLATTPSRVMSPDQQASFQDSWKLSSSESHDGSFTDWTTVHELRAQAIRFLAP